MLPWRITAALVIAVLAASGPLAAPAAAAAGEDPPKLLGRVTPEQLAEEPYSEWYQKGYMDYQPHADILEQLRQLQTEGLELTAFFGTWCGDSKREIPRLVKILDLMAFPRESLTLVAVDNEDGTAKQSPGGEHQGREVYRVPVVAVSRGGVEQVRFVEHPVLSLERDLLAMLSGEAYAPNYSVYPTVRRWFRQGLLSDANISPRGLGEQIRSEVTGPGDLAAAGQVLLARGDVAEAVQVLKVNAVLFPEDAPAFRRLAAALKQQGELAEARKAAERALLLNKDPLAMTDILALLDETRVNGEE